MFRTSRSCLQHHEPGGNRCGSFVCAPGSSGGAPDCRKRVVDVFSRSAQLRKNHCVEIPIGKGAALELMFSGRDFKDTAKQNSFGSVSTNVRITDGLELSVRRSDNADAGDAEAFRLQVAQEPG